MAIDYAERLKELGFEICYVQRNNHGVITTAEINLKSCVVAFYAANEKPQIKLMMGRHNTNFALETEVKSAEILKDNGIPYDIVPQNIVSELQEQIKIRKSLLTRIKKLKPQNQ